MANSSSIRVLGLYSIGFTRTATFLIIQSNVSANLKNSGDYYLPLIENNWIYWSSTVTVNGTKLSSVSSGIQA